MSRIRIRNFGPIKEGFTENDGFMGIKKVTVFIGNQGSGKSTVAELITSLIWLEKALRRGDFLKNKITSKNGFEKLCDYFRLKNYFQHNTEIEYKGKVYDFIYKDKRLNVFENNSSGYLTPKIMFVPAERNILSTLRQPDKVKGLPAPLYEFLIEFDKALNELIGDLPLPIGNLSLQYQKLKNISNIIGHGFKIELLEASSGLQALVPLYLVSRSLALSIGKKDDSSIKSLSVEEEKKIRAEVKTIYNNEKLPDDIKKAAIEELSSKYRKDCFINIVEEPEQNLFPSSQQHILYSLLEFANLNEGNKLIMTTHSPYIINYLTLAVKANDLKGKVKTDELKNKLEDIVPLNSTINPDDLVIYELNERDGSIIKLGTYEGLPSDKNYLNISLGEGNRLFDSLLEIEEEL